jgi:RNA polymerase sigma factor (sigma-70 family)
LIRFVQKLRTSMRTSLEAERDGELLRRFVEQRDEAAFEALVRRHGPMVLGVCLRILRNRPDADDAFQASFLVLLRKAPSIRSADTLACWLFGVAQRTALEARRSAARRRALEARVMPREREPASELREVLDQELARLPKKYRMVVILCDLEDRSRKEASQELGVAEGTVASRLARGRLLLADRLRKHGIPLAGGALTDVGSASVPPALVRSTVTGASGFLAGNAGAISSAVEYLAEAVLKGMVAGRAQLFAWIALGLLLIAGGTATASYLASPDRASVAGQGATGADGDVKSPPVPPDVWEMDFERQREGDLRHGRFTAAALPRGSRGAAMAVRVDQGEEGVYFMLSVPKTRGPLFTVHPDSHLHFTYRMDRPDWINLFLIACCPDGSHSSNYLFNKLDYSPRHSGKWRTVSIPVSRFRRLYLDGVEPWKAEYPNLLIFSSPGADRGLVVDRVWVTRGGPGEVRYQAVD